MSRQRIELQCTHCEVRWFHPTFDNYQAKQCWLCGRFGSPYDVLKHSPDAWTRSTGGVSQ